MLEVNLQLPLASRSVFLLASPAGGDRSVLRASAREMQAARIQDRRAARPPHLRQPAV